MHWEDPEGSGGERGGWGGSGWGIHVYPWLIHVNVSQKPLQYCKVISLQLIKKKKQSFRTFLWMTFIYFLFLSLYHNGSSSAFFFFKTFFILFLELFGCTHCCVRAFSSCSEWGLLSSCSAWASYCSGFSCCGAQALDI